MGNALLLANQTSEAELAFERALQLKPDSVIAETNAASAYLQAGDSDWAILHLERAVSLDPLHLPADAPLIQLYKQQGNTAKADELSGAVRAAMNRQSVPSGIAEEPSSGSSTQTTDSVYKNIQVLKGISSDQLIPAMRFITTSLGVECSYCHVPDHFDKDDKKPKQIARDMMRMMFAIDKDSFQGNREVTCYSCHRGSTKPEAIPMAESEGHPKPQSAATLEAEKLPGNLPTVDQLIDTYIRALGGVAAISRISSREARGRTTVGGQAISVEIFDQEPNKQSLIRHTPAGDSSTVFNGQDGWIGLAEHPVRDMRGAELEAAQIDADLHFPLHIKQMFSELHVEYPEKIRDREAYVISAASEGKPPVKFYFDEESGLLVRLVRYAVSPLGLIPTNIDYGDYRDVDGVEIPFRWTMAQADGSSTIQLEQMQQNVPIDDTKFAKPTPSSALPGPSQP
jgi:hypothetical protein